jgi:hypothetical protein
VNANEFLRLLIEDVTLTRDREIHLHLRWKGGATTSLELPLSGRDLHRTSATVVELIRALASAQTDRQIAETLNARWLRTGTGLRFTGLAVWRIRQAYAIRSLAQHKRETGWHTAAEISAQLHIHTSTLKATHAKESSTPSASTTKVRFFSSRSMDRRPHPITENDFAISVVIPNLHRTCARRCSMKREP